MFTVVLNLALMFNLLLKPLPFPIDALKWYDFEL
jgi:hypothetical protein